MSSVFRRKFASNKKIEKMNEYIDAQELGIDFNLLMNMLLLVWLKSSTEIEQSRTIFSVLGSLNVLIWC